MEKLIVWFDDRTGYQAFLRAVLYENIPGGSRWRYVWGSTLVFTFMVQFITGIFLWMCYSPSSRTAWESVYYIQYEMQGGWLLRGLHHVTAQAMVVLLALHFVQVVIDGAYKAPREVNFWLGLILMQIVLGLALTGYLLPWDQKGYWATKVATNLLAGVPGVGPTLQKLVVGGPTYGHGTLTRFFALHAGVLPILLVLVLTIHLALFRRHGICAKRPYRQPARTFWPEQVLKDSIACLAVLAVVLFFVVWGLFEDQHPNALRAAHLGAELGAPADPASQFKTARPEWYFLFLFQMLKYFPGAYEVIGAVFVPGLVMFLLLLMPLLGRWKLGHGFNVALTVALGIGVCVLTVVALVEDRNNEDYNESVRIAESDRLRAVELAQNPDVGIPVEGAMWLMRNDPKMAGPILFKQQCANCHSHEPRGSGEDQGRQSIASQHPTASNLWGFGSADWVRGVLDPEQIDQGRYFGHTAHNEGDMVTYVKDSISDPNQWTQAQIDDVITALSAEAALNPIDPRDARLQSKIEAGRMLIQDADRCAQCHKFGDEDPNYGAPDLTGYGSQPWMIDFISNPSHERFYGENNDEMPAFATDPNNPKNNIFTRRNIELIVDWLRGDWYESKVAR